jgi:hypothetical protein
VSSSSLLESLRLSVGGKFLPSCMAALILGLHLGYRSFILAKTRDGSEGGVIASFPLGSSGSSQKIGDPGRHRFYLHNL